MNPWAFVIGGLLLVYVVFFIAGARARTSAWGPADIGSVVAALLLILYGLVLLHVIPA